MKTAVFSTKSYDQRFLRSAAQECGHDLTFFEPRLSDQTSVLANGFPAVCAFVNDQLHQGVLAQLASGGTRLIALRCAGFNNVDLQAAAELGIKVVRVPAYSPHAVAEHTVGLMLALNRHLHKAYNRVRDGNFSLERLLGFDLNGQTVGIVGTGQIGSVVARILHGFGCRILLHDVIENEACRAYGQYAPLPQLLSQSDILTLHCPLVPQTHHLIDRRALDQMRTGVMLINTSRGALIDTQAVIAALKSGKIGYLGLDVYEEESDLFFEDLSGQVIQDDVFSRLLTFPNVIITGHQAFFTRNALEAIARVTMENITAFERGDELKNEVTADRLKK
jgi:D-lactate dehydrogenase